MLVGIVGFGILSGLLAAMMVMGGFGSILLAILAYAVFGSLGATLYAVAMAHRQSFSRDEDMAGGTEPQA
jgi:hypothetical protein